MPNFSVYGMILQTRILACMCVCVCDKLLQSCPTLCDPMDCGMPSSFVHRDSPGKNTRVGCHEGIVDHIHEVYNGKSSKDLENWVLSEFASVQYRNNLKEKQVIKGICILNGLKET